MPGPDMREYLADRVGHTLRTVTGKPNTVRSVRDAAVKVATDGQASGADVSLALIQDVVDRIFDGEEVELDPQRRSAFVAAVLLTMEEVEVLTNPRRARLAVQKAAVGSSGLDCWWAALPEQRFWMEVTGRADVGTDLHAPQRDDAGNENWTYSLVREVQDGDLVFHYEKSATAVTSWSIAAGGFWEEDTLWGTPRSTGPSGHPVQPYKRPGLWHGLHGPFRLDVPVTLADLRKAETELKKIRGKLQAQHPRQSLYYPVQFRRDGVRAQQGYLVKLPAEVVALFPQLSAVASAAGGRPAPQAADGAELGLAYDPADEQARQAHRDPFPVDPAIVERGVRSHASLQNLLAAHVQSRGYEPKRPGPDDPAWDLLWRDENGEVWVAEIKSLTPRNEERQLRLGLGQLLRYRQRLAAQEGIAHAVLMAEYEPGDQTWLEVCAEVGVILTFPDALASAVS